MTLSAAAARRRLLTISLGSWQASIVERSALGRLGATSALTYFDEVEHIFYRTEASRVEEPLPGLRVRDVAGREGEVAGVSKLAAFLSGAREVRRIADEFQPDVVQVVDPFQSGLLGRRIARRLGVPLVLMLVSHYDNSRRVSGRWPSQWMPEGIAFKVHDLILREADLILTDRKFYVDYAIERGARAEAIRRHPMWVESEFHEADPDPDVLAKHGIEDARPLLYVGRLHAVKYSGDLLKAYLKIREVHPGKQLVVLGGAGPMREEFEAGIRAAGASEDVLIKQVNSAAEVKSWMSAAGVMMAPHAGYALLEAGLSATPVVAYDFEWHPELITDGVTGRLVPFRDWKAMAEVTLDLLADPAGTERLGTRLRERVESEHTHDAVRTSIAGAFRELLEGR